MNQQQQQHQRPPFHNQTNQNHTKSRPSASCIPCRNRKVKCNRLHPCSTCITRNNPNECHYTATDIDRDAMKNAEGIAALRSKIRSLKGSLGDVDSQVDFDFNSGQRRAPAQEWDDGDGDGDGGFGNGYGYAGGGEDAEREAMEIVYNGLRHGHGDVADGIVKMVRGGVDMEEVAYYVRTQEEVVLD